MTVPRTMSPRQSQRNGRVSAKSRLEWILRGLVAEIHDIGFAALKECVDQPQQALGLVTFDSR